MAKTDNAELHRQLLARFNRLNTQRFYWLAHWKDIQAFIVPDQGFGLSGMTTQMEQENGQKKYQHIIDGTAGRALKILAAGLQSGLTSPSRPWFRLGLQDKSLMERNTVKRWLATVEDQIRYVFNRSNAYRSLHHCYLELGAFGTAAQLISENFHTGIHCRPFTAGEFWLGVDHLLKVNTFYRSFWVSAEQMIGEFGVENVSDSVKAAYKNNGITLFEVIQALEPNDDRLDLQETLGRPYRSIYFERATGADKVLKISGYEEFPVQAPRWQVIAGKIYGASCAQEVLGDVKMLQKLHTKQLVNLDKAMDPPLKAPQSLKNDVVSGLPGGVTFTDDAGRDAFGPLYTVPLAIQEAEMKIEKTAARIGQGFFSDLFLMLANQPTRSGVTATEIAERHEEKLLMLGPVLERLDSELLDPMIDRTFSILMRAHMLPPAPAEIRGANLHVEYISVLAQAQKMVGVTSIQQFAGFVGSVAGAKPEVLDKIDFDAMTDEYADRVGLPPKILNPDDVVKNLRAARAKQQQQAQAQAAIPQAVQSAKTLSETNLSGNNALNALMGRMPGVTPPPN